MDPVLPPPVMIDQPRPHRDFLNREEVVTLIVAMPVPFLCLLLFPGGINTTMEASAAALRVAPFVLSVPVLVSLALAVQYLWRRLRYTGAGAVSPNALFTSLAVVLFWVCALGWQSHKDAMFQRDLEARLQPWAESILSRPRAEVLEKGTNWVRAELLPEFIGHHYPGYVTVQKAGDWPVEANERAIVDVYGVHQSIGGYIAGRKTLKVEQGGPRRVRKIKDGLYRFQNED